LLGIFDMALATSLRAAQADASFATMLASSLRMLVLEGPEGESRAGADIGFSPGFRWGTSLLPGDAITREHVMDQTAITYPYSTLNDMSGEQIKTILEDVADNLFNPDPYLQQGGDMVRVSGMTYTLAPREKIGSRISDMRLGGKPLQADKRYKVAGWAPVAEGAQGEPIWDVVARYLRDKKTIKALKPNVPKLVGVGRNPGLA
jgi:sulfur-oxidizing protein SoxB